ncbi:hypothetical protein [Halobacteriovorax sp. JY17]|uniref:hypothetical protein n=1 Tax=Halobacteriovorax sp. JY17 TaxID=2014617 RepID=UPI000C44E63D|nr:hypothetical protein [Halobacteriovorax sp. JY17]PIK15128.1 MAG: hypothetical protein CES88_00015 [Halobacteriovorax sp. JY17]
MELIDVDRRYSIDSLIQTLKENKSKIRVWQSIKETGDYSFGVIESINSLNRTIKIRIKKSESTTLDKRQHIYFHSSCRDIIFKAQIRDSAQGCLEVSLPVLVKLQEARAEKRTNLGIQSTQYAKVLLIRSSHEKLESKLRVLDFSARGMALMVNKFIFEGLSVDDKIIVTQVSPEGEAENKTYVIRNKGSILNKIGSSKEFRIGLEFCG